jgi:hypothetical protein
LGISFIGYRLGGSFVSLNFLFLEYLGGNAIGCRLGTNFFSGGAIGCGLCGVFFNFGLIRGGLGEHLIGCDPQRVSFSFGLIGCRLGGSFIRGHFRRVFFGLAFTGCRLGGNFVGLCFLFTKFFGCDPTGRYLVTNFFRGGAIGRSFCGVFLGLGLISRRPGIDFVDCRLS